ncbi:aminotransferase class V-fold PLP-dependent enzyme [candidate division WOR-3 bacterium]|uniref:cysteine desulfurase n=1 Tax=candidate division WOR-3 bacterium TaxID=2052148 RepID=A0A938BR14_UNCW3|nr:aminotransferase class V-fold PLP-dependent enzyme [candidate division WOR-3 bacterium]
MTRVYLDNNSTTPVDPRVAAAMEPYLHEVFGNPSNIHSFGRECAETMAEAREQVATFLGASPEEIFFTGGGSEADNWAVKGTAFARADHGKHVVCSAIEHSAVLESCRYLESVGFRATYLPVDRYGLVDPDAAKQALTPETALVSVMLANNEIGTIEPVAEIARICREAGVTSHTDAVAAAGKMRVDVKELGVDLLTISAHKLQGPKGVGALYIREGTKIHPLVHGGHQEKGLRGGTENVIGIAGLGKACEILKAEWQQNAEHERKLRDRLEQAIMARVPELILDGHPDKRLPNICHVCVGYVEGEALLMNLDMEGVAVASGSACSTGSAEPSPTIKAIGIPPLFANSPVRLSFGPGNTEAEIDYTIEVFDKVVARLRSISPIWNRRA